MRRLLCITAHPDDEASSFGGTLRLYADGGVETSVVCLTPGQAASHRGSARSDAELAAIRREEFASACKMLGVKHAVVLGYSDGQLHRLDSYLVVRELVRHIRRLRPQVLLTFGPEGSVTAHTDHSMTSVFATLAFHWAGRGNRFSEQIEEGLKPYGTQKLYYATAKFHLPQREVRLAPATVALDVSEFVETKVAAFRAHASQAPLFQMFEQIMHARGGKEYFHLAASSSFENAGQEKDLFEGVEEEQEESAA
jgi:LmbE family N-acetylglucosaminyl deacetylase